MSTDNLDNAIRTGDLNEVKSLLRANPSLATAVNDEGETPLHLAAGRGATAIAALLLDFDAKVDAVNRRNFTPLHFAARGGYSETIEMLLTRDADAGARIKDGRTALHLTTTKGAPAAAKALLDHKADANARDSRQTTPLHLAAGAGHIKLVELLLSRRADITAKDQGGWTALHYAANDGRKETVQLLLERGADPTLKDAENRSPLALAQNQRHWEVVRLFNRAETKRTTTPSGQPAKKPTSDESTCLGCLGILGALAVIGLIVNMLSGVFWPFMALAVGVSALIGRFRYNRGGSFWPGFVTAIVASIFLLALLPFTHTSFIQDLQQRLQEKLHPAQPEPRRSTPAPSYTPGHIDSPHSSLDGKLKYAVDSNDGAKVVYVRACTYTMGDAAQADNPPHEVKLSAYWIYKDDVTVAQYKRFCKKTGHSMPGAPDFDRNQSQQDANAIDNGANSTLTQIDRSWSQNDHPIVNVSWDDAEAYAKWAGGDLPTEAQWERAARGGDGRKYPWGNQFMDSRIWKAGETGAVGKLGLSPYTCSDMAGNVRQWCRDYYSNGFWQNGGPQVLDPVNTVATSSHVVRGGSWRATDPGNFLSSRRGFADSTERTDFEGFRCVIPAGSH